VAFYSEASNLVPDDTNGCLDVFVHDRQTGATERVSVDSDGNQGNRASRSPSISGDGRYVAVWSWASNLVPGDTNTSTDVFVHDRQTRATARVSVDSAGSQGNSDSYPPSVSADGRYVAFYSEASNLVPDDTNGYLDVFVHDRQTGATERLSVDSGGNQGNGESEYPAISADGRYVAFDSGASNLVPGDTNYSCDNDNDDVYDDNCSDVFVHDRQTGATERVSVDSAGSQGNANSIVPAISVDARYVAFWSWAPNLVPGVSGVHVYVHDRGQPTSTITVNSTADTNSRDGVLTLREAMLLATGGLAGGRPAGGGVRPGLQQYMERVVQHDRHHRGRLRRHHRLQRHSLPASHTRHHHPGFHSADIQHGE
jgi:hypothetical protein